MLKKINYLCFLLVLVFMFQCILNPIVYATESKEESKALNFTSPLETRAQTVTSSAINVTADMMGENGTKLSSNTLSTMAVSSSISSSNIAFLEQWYTQPYNSNDTNVISNDGGILKIRSKSIYDPFICMYGLGSFDPNTYRYIEIKYKMAVGSPKTGFQVFFTSTEMPDIAEERSVFSGELVADGQWHIYSLDMWSNPKYKTGGNITGWRYDWASNGVDVTMDLDYISLVAQPTSGEQAKAINLAENRTYSTNCSSYRYQTPDKAILGSTSFWNGADFPYNGSYYWQMDFGTPTKFQEITAKIMCSGIGGSTGYMSGEIQVSLDQNSWVKLKSFDVSEKSDISVKYRTETPITYRYVRFVYLNGNSWLSLADLFITTEFAPSISDTIPYQNQALSETDTSFIPQVSVSDADNDTLTCKYYIDSETTPRDTKSVSNTEAAQAVNFNAFHTGTLTEGDHTIKYEVSDSYTTPITRTINFKVDKSNPTLGTVTSSSTINNITLSGSATDSISGLHATPYRYTIGSEVSAWLTGTAYTCSNDLIPNTQYATKFEAMDAKGHIAGSTQNIYTKAAIPLLTADNPSSYTLDVGTSDNNPASTQYQISVNNGASYVTQEGTLTAAPVWITLTGKKVTVTGLNPSQTYSFNAKTRNAENVETASSQSVSGTTLIAPPGSPANIIATATNKTITVSWNAAGGALRYDIEADGAIINTGTATAYTHGTLNPGTPHTYRVRAINAGGAGNWSSSISKSTLPGSPEIPVNLSAIPLSTSVTITWNNVPGATGYDIEADGVLVNNGPNTNYIHNSLTPGTHHSYRVRSINAGGKSAWSAEVTATTLLDTVPVPVNITAVQALNSIVLSWDAVNGASGYEIEADGVTFDNNTRTTYTHSSLAPGTQHIYRIRAKKGGIKSDWSAAVVSTTLTNTFGTPVNFKAKADKTSVALSWDQVPDAAGYDVEVDGIVTDNNTETNCIHNGLLPNSEHTYRVRARNADETSDWTSPLTITTFILSIPENVTASSDETSISVSWQPVEGAASYELDFDGSIISNITATTYSAIGLTADTQHVIKVKAVNGSGMSNWSTPLTQSTLFTTQNVPIVSGLAKKTSIVLMWNKMDAAVSYEVEADGIVTSVATGSALTITGLDPATQHKYRVRALNNSGTGNWSSLFNVSTLAQGPSAPSNIAASSNMTSLLATWDKVAGAEEYEIAVDGNVISSGSSTSYLYTGLTPDTAHTFKVRSKNISGYSEWSDTVTAKTLSSVQTFNISSASGEEFDLLLSASNIQDLSKYTFTIKYNTDDFEVTDLCGLTAKADTVEGDITGTDITVKQAVPGTIVFTKSGTVQSWQVWSGMVNSITLKAKHDRQATVTYTIQ